MQITLVWKEKTDTNIIVLQLQPGPDVKNASPQQ